jgi:hypothetical protein
MNEQHDKYWINLFSFFGFEYVKPYYPDAIVADNRLNPMRERGRYIFYNTRTIEIKDNQLLEELDHNDPRLDVYGKNDRNRGLRFLEL